MSALNPLTEAMDRIDEIAACLDAVTDLMSPGADLHAVDRNKQAVLLAFLLAEHRLACARLTQAAQAGQSGQAARKIHLTACKPHSI